MKRLTLAATVLLGAFTQVAAADSVKKVSIITMVDTPQLLEVRDGVLEGLQNPRLR